MKAVFLDRDGVLNENVFYPDTSAFESPRRASDFRLFPETIPTLLVLQAAGFLLFLVSNQPNVAKGKSTLLELQQIEASLLSALEAAQITFTEFYYCYHHPDSSVPDFGGACDCRKPSPYFLLKAAKDFAVELAASWMIGDRLTDIECGNRAGAQTILLDRDGSLPVELPSPSTPASRAASLHAAVAIILAPAS